MREIAIPLAYGSSPARSALAGDARLINGFAERVEAGKADAVVYGVSGLTQWAQIDDICRGFLPFENDTLLAVVGSKIVALDGNGDPTVYTGIVPGRDRCILAKNANVERQGLLVCNAGIFSISQEKVSFINKPDLFDVPIRSVDWVDGYFVIAMADGRFFISAINDITVDALDFATAEVDPDGLVRAFVNGRELLLFGSKSLEVWHNLGLAAFPFQRADAKLTTGLGARHSVARVNQQVMFVDSTGIVQRLANGYTAQRISNVGVEKAIQALGDFSEVFALTYSDKGHDYYVLSSDQWTWVYDLSTGQWHERRSGLSSRWQASHCEWFAGKFIVASRDIPKLFYIDDSKFSEDGDPLIFTMRLPVVEAFPSGALVSRLNIDCETGVGDASQFVARALTWDMLNIMWDSDAITMDQTHDIHADLPDVAGAFPEYDPEMMLRWSDDGGRSWSQGMRAKLGKQAEVRRVKFDRLGAFKRQGRIFEISVSASVFRAILAAKIMAEPRSL